MLCVLAGIVLAGNTDLANSIGTVMVDGEQKKIDINSNYSIGSNDAENVQITSNFGTSLDIMAPAKSAINGQQLTVNGGIYCRYDGVKLTIGMKCVTNTVRINSSKQHVVFSGNNANININAENININSYADGAAPAVWIQSGGSVSLNGENINVKSKEYGVVAFP